MIAAVAPQPSGERRTPMATEADLPARLRPIAKWSAPARRAIRFVLLDIDDTLTTEGRLTAAAYAALERLSRRGFRDLGDRAARRLVRPDSSLLAG